MANQPKTRARGIRIPDDTWDALTRLATTRGKSVSDLVREALTEYVERNP